MLGTYQSRDNKDIVVTSNKKRVAYGGTRKVRANWYRCHDTGINPYGHCSVHSDTLKDKFTRLS